MNNKISFQVRTLSNLFIGGAPASFEIGGIDQYTVTDPHHFPYIPASSFKGTLATIIREDTSETGAKISELYKRYLEKMEAENQEQIQNLALEAAALKRMKARYEEALAKKNKAEHLFGISGFNNTPKLIFNDLLLGEAYRNMDSCFSIDIKNSITYKDEKPEANPRSYKAARSGLVFEGSIILHKIAVLGEDAEELSNTFIKDNLLKLNEGIYRLGNSKSRGYGRVEVHILEK